MSVTWIECDCCGEPRLTVEACSLHGHLKAYACAACRGHPEEELAAIDKKEAELIQRMDVAIKELARLQGTSEDQARADIDTVLKEFTGHPAERMK